MLYTKAHGDWPFGSREEDFWRVFTIYGHVGYLGHVTQMPRTNFRSPDSTWNLASIGPAVLEKKIFENGGRTTDGQRTDGGACLYYELINEPKGSGELKR